MPKVSTKTLSDTRIQRAKVKRAKDGTPVVSYLWDSSIRGFGLRITPQGNKLFCMKFIGPDGKQAWLAMGPYTGEKSLVEAKELAASYKGMLSKGLDPRIEAKKHLLIPTFEEFVTEHLAWLVSRLSDEEKAVIAVKPKWLPPYLHGTKVFLDQIACPVLGPLRLNEVSRNHIQALVDDTAKGRRPWMKPSEKPKKATKTAANRLHAALSKLFTEAERKGHIHQGANPCKLVVKQAESKGRERFLTLEELEWLGKVLKDAPNWGDKEACPYAWEKIKVDGKDEERHLEIPTTYALAAIKLLVLTGARLSEILKLRWSQVDRHRKVIRFDAHKTSKKTGAKEIPINASVAAVLEELDTLPGRELNGPWVIQGHRHGSHLVNLQKPWGRIRKAVSRASGGAVNLDDLRIHDLRHSFASVAVSEGYSLPMIGSLLGHTQAATTQRYSHLHTDPRLKASEKISSKIASALG